MATENESDTLLDEVQRHLKEDHKIPEEILSQLDYFLQQELYDSDALDLDTMGQNATDSHIGSINLKLYKAVQQCMWAAKGIILATSEN